MIKIQSRNINEGIISRVGDMFYAFRFLKLLVTPWNKTKAFEYGLVDKIGKRIKSPSTPQEKSAYTIFHRLVFNVKRLLGKFPGGKTKIASYATALYMIKEHTDLSEKKIRQIMDKADVDLDWDSFDIQESKWFIDENNRLNPGSYVLNKDVMSPITAEFIAKANTRVKIKESLEPHAEFLGCSIYKVLHTKTNHEIYITNEDISR
tara:strand:+ start:580 stop:1197 length:618 start_codon:yes stop_codon:yes gene_type:complete